MDITLLDVALAIAISLISYIAGFLTSDYLYTVPYAPDEEEMVESRRRGMEAGLAKARAVRYGGRPEPDPITEMEATEFFIWLAQKEANRETR